MKNEIKVTSKKDGVVFASDPSGGIKVSLHGLKKEDYKSIRRGKIINF